MSILLEVPLQAIPNQTITITLNNQTFNLSINAISVNNKRLLNNTPNYLATDEVINNVTVSASSIFMMCNIKIADTPIIYNVFANNCVYLNAFPSSMVGYLFFYRDTWQTGDDTINYANFGAGGDTHLYYSDYDALATTFDNFVSTNYTTLAKQFLYG